MPENPLTEKDLLDIEQALAELEEAEASAQMAQQAGIDVTRELQQIRENREKLLRIKQTYFPNA